jgi:hypothetical protein
MADVPIPDVVAQMTRIFGLSVLGISHLLSCKRFCVDNLFRGKANARVRAAFILAVSASPPSHGFLGDDVLLALDPPQQ